MQRVFPSLFGKIREIELTMHSVEKMLILFHRKKFRQISSIVTSLVKTLLSRNFCQKRVRVKFRNFHNV